MVTAPPVPLLVAIRSHSIEFVLVAPTRTTFVSTHVRYKLMRISHCFNVRAIYPFLSPIRLSIVSSSSYEYPLHRTRMYVNHQVVNSPEMWV